MCSICLLLFKFIEYQNVSHWTNCLDPSVIFILLLKQIMTLFSILACLDGLNCPQVSNSVSLCISLNANDLWKGMNPFLLPASSK